MGLKVYRLWVMGQLDSTCRAPPGRLFARLPFTLPRKLPLALPLLPGIAPPSWPTPSPMRSNTLCRGFRVSSFPNPLL
jgi:hypothetical protein